MADVGNVFFESESTSFFGGWKAFVREGNF